MFLLNCQTTGYRKEDLCEVKKSLACKTTFKGSVGFKPISGLNSTPSRTGNGMPSNRRPWQKEDPSASARPTDTTQISTELHAVPVAWWNMSLLEFLRKSNDQGAISGWLTQIWKAPGQPKGIEAFTNAYSMSGEEVVACVVMSGLNNLSPVLVAHRKLVWSTKSLVRFLMFNASGLTWRTLHTQFPPAGSSREWLAFRG